jgi:galactose mutarotase-like enzyme
MELEKLTLLSDALRVEVLPELGAKISSLRCLVRDEELLQKPLKPYAPRSRTMAFEEGDASGIDECIPTVSGCKLGEKILPDHGDFWRLPFRHRREGETWVFDAQGFSLSLHFEKRLTLRGNRLEIAYVLSNTGFSAVPFLWSAHPGFAVDAGDSIVLPESVTEVSVWYSEGARLGVLADAHPWPQTRDQRGAHVDLSAVGGPKEGVGDKLFVLAPAEGWVALFRRRLRCRIEVHFDPTQNPYVGLWLAYGGWPREPGLRQHCVALEPCTSPADSLATAVEQGWARTLAPGARWKWKIELRVVSE